MAEIRRVSIPAIPATADPAMRRFLEAMRSYLLARDGQTKVARQDDQTNLAKREMRDLLPGMVELLVKEGIQDIILGYIANAKNLYVQPEEPDFRGQTGVWVQTGLPAGAFEIFIVDGTGQLKNIKDLIGGGGSSGSTYFPSGW